MAPRRGYREAPPFRSGPRQAFPTHPGSHPEPGRPGPSPNDKTAAMTDVVSSDLLPADAGAEAAPYTGPREIKLADLKDKSPTELTAFAEEHEVENASTLRKQELMFAILKQLASREIEIVGDGVIEVLQDGFGFLRSPDANYLAGPDDIYVSPSQIRRFGLRTGDTVEGLIRAPKEGERYFALLKVNTINFEDPEKVRHKVNFDNLTPLYPERRLKLEIEDPTARTVAARDRHRRADRQGPARLDRRAAADRQDRAAAEHRASRSPPITPSAILIVLLIDERPEEVTDMQRSVKGEVVSSTFDEPATRHVQVAEMVIEKAKRLVEHKPRRRHPARLDHAARPRLQHRRALVRQGADRRCRRQRAAAAQALLRRGAQHRGGRLAHHHRHRADRYRLAHGRGDLRGVQGHRQFRDHPRPQGRRQAHLPAIDIARSGTRKEELLVTADILKKMYVLRRILNPMGTVDGIEFLIGKLRETPKGNGTFFESMNT